MGKLSEQLRKEGMAESRVYAIESIVQLLHSELCKLDLRNLRLFMKFGVAGNLQRYAQSEELRDVIGEAWLDNIKLAFDLTDKSGEVDMLKRIEQITDILMDFQELGLPGANLLAQSLEQYRKLWVDYTDSLRR